MDTIFQLYVVGAILISILVKRIVTRVFQIKFDASRTVRNCEVSSSLAVSILITILIAFLVSLSGAHPFNYDLLYVAGLYLLAGGWCINVLVKHKREISDTDSNKAESKHK